MEAASDPGDQKRVRRRTFLIDRKFQLKYTLIIVLVGILVSGLLGYFIYRLNLENRELLGIDAEIMSHVEQIDSHFMIYLIGFVVVMAVALFIWGIFITHRVAGPIFIISRYLGQIRDGQVPQPRPLRKGDELKSFFETFSGMLASMKQRNLDEAEQLSKIAEEVGKQGGDPLKESAKALKNLAESKKAWGNPAEG
jgi:hypothetical protein